VRSGGGVFSWSELKEYLPPGGSLVLLLPGKVLAGERYMRFRKGLVEQDALEAIVRLPNGLFPMVRVDVDLLLARQEKPAETKGRVLFADASALPVDRGKKALAGGLAGKIVDLYSAFSREGEVAGPGGSGLHHRIVLTGEIERVKSGSRDRDYNLDVSRYVVPEPEPVDLEEEFERLAEYERWREKLGRKMEEQMGRVLERMRERGREI
jgi:type I restriction enzyme M protein